MHTQGATTLTTTMPAGASRELEAHVWQRHENDWYVEPPWVSKRLFEEEAFVGDVHDPACGGGNIVKSARERGLVATGSDIARRTTEPFEMVNFLDQLVIRSNIVTNPPFNIADKFVAHALGLAQNKVAIVFPVARLNAAHWIKGTPLRRIWLLTPRPSMPPGEVIARGEKPGGGKMDYCWLVWEKGHVGHPETRWLKRDKAS